MAFTVDVDTARGRVRLLIGDTDTAKVAAQIFTDAEIDAFLAIESNEVYPAAAAAAESIASSKAKSAIAWKALDTQFDLKEIPKHYMAIAARWRERGTDEPWEKIDSLDYRVSSFGRDQSEYVGDTRF